MSKESVNMKNKILNITPYITGLIYLIYCLANINYWVKSHLGFGFYVLIPIVIAIVLSIIYIALKIFVKKKFNFYLPLFYLIIGFVINIVGSNISCCFGG